MRQLHCLCAVLLFGATSPAWGAGEQFTNFPTPAAGAFNVVVAPMQDGRLLVWNGGDVFEQAGVNVDYFTQVASGYPGDASFLAITPDGSRAALGAGYSGAITVVALNAPGTPVASINTVNNYSGVWISNTQLLINRALYVGPGPYDYDLPELVLVDFSGTPTFKVVVEDVGTYSAAIAVDAALQYIYTADGWTGETRRFAVANLINAFNTNTPLTWTSGALIGTYNSGGPAGVDNDGNLIIGGFGSIQTVNPTTGLVVNNYDPVGTGFEFYNAGFNPFTGLIIAIQSVYLGVPGLWTPADTLIPLPGLTGLGIVACLAALSALGARKARGLTK
ncbi:MAG: hypothetical protein K1Y02_09830 [Candidatus Hydrogenedentes bacterium]|nr:hypothetical protein [Candidatus Hydrogenedentota bacterium]